MSETDTFLVPITLQVDAVDEADAIRRADDIVWTAGLDPIAMSADVRRRGLVYVNGPEAAERSPVASQPDGVAPATDVLYEKCAGCHLFIEPNPSGGDGVAGYLHLHRGDAADEALDASHAARPSGMKATLATWRTFGPAPMRARFTDDTG